MNDGTSAPRTCKVCGDPIRVNNTYGICSDLLKPECQKVRLRERRKRSRGDDTPERHCKVCGALLRFDNTTGICSGANSTPECNRERKNLERIAMGLPPYEPAPDVTEVRAGDTFGLWTVLEDGRGVVNYVLSRCACGTERPIMIARLTEGRSTSCGTECDARRAANPYLLPGTYGQLEVLEAALRAKDMVRVHCDRCGNFTTKQAGLVKNGNTATCGCGKGKFTHGLSRHPLWGTWDGMRDRCTNPTAKGYKDWGGRGITICEGWTGAPDGFLNFVADMGMRPTPSHTVDRLDNDGGYWCGRCTECIRLGRPGNCRWATKRQQALNRRSVAKVTLRLDAALAEIARLKAQQGAAPVLVPTVPKHRKAAPGPGAMQGELF